MHILEKQGKQQQYELDNQYEQQQQKQRILQQEEISDKNENQSESQEQEQQLEKNRDKEQEEKTVNIILAALIIIFLILVCFLVRKKVTQKLKSYGYKLFGKNENQDFTLNNSNSDSKEQSKKNNKDQKNRINDLGLVNKLSLEKNPDKSQDGNQIVLTTQGVQESDIREKIQKFNLEDQKLKTQQQDEQASVNKKLFYIDDEDDDYVNKSYQKFNQIQQQQDLDEESIQYSNVFNLEGETDKEQSNSRRKRHLSKHRGSVTKKDGRFWWDLWGTKNCF
ncbi:hypothetical protein PPERSA_08136 [Pseudocohnilembus persalinus]|uniref:Transmembrane protein n=1 Tax=Pseudocohnilembus persalinus TaxID=266149 RepID=A0A0V0QMA7_PSEPJ|nr:hypothetical protein PPERSA_08136 [Pseudocohnilembus persalinus]|eukprot:KRX03394.1 hypothetical protein PPERSA_08136 [Pseudocohnilembus persalinus]